MPQSGNAVHRACTSAGIAGVAAGFAAMLPGAAAGVLGAIGIGGSSALARTLSPAAEPSSSRPQSASPPAPSPAAASSPWPPRRHTLLYLSMFQLASGNTTNGSMSMTSMQQPQNEATTLHAEPATFYLGVALFAAALGLTIWRRHRRACRPILRLPQPSIARR